MRGHTHRFLAGGGIEHEQDFLRLDQALKIDQFLNEILINLQPARGIKDQHIAGLRAGFLHGGAGDLLHILLTLEREHRHIDLLTECLQLIHRRRPIHIRRDEQRLAALFLNQLGELAAGGGFTRTMQANHHDAGGIAAGLELGVGIAKQRDQFIVNDLHDLLARLNAGQHLIAEGFLLNASEEFLGHLEVDVRLQQRHTHLAQGLGDIVLRNLAQPAQVLKRTLKFAAQRIKHGRSR